MKQLPSARGKRPNKRRASRSRSGATGICTFLISTAGVSGRALGYFALQRSYSIGGCRLSGADLSRAGLAVERPASASSTMIGVFKAIPFRI